MVVLRVCLGTVQYQWISIGHVIAQLRAVFCPSVQYLSFFCEGFSRTIWTVVAFSCFTVVKPFTSWYAIFIIIIIYPLTAKVVGAPQMISQPGSSTFSLLSTALWDLANSRLVRSLMLSSTSSSVCLVFFPLSLCLARWFMPSCCCSSSDFLQSY